MKTEIIATKDATYRGKVDLVASDMAAVWTGSKLRRMSVVVTIPVSNSCNYSSHLIDETTNPRSVTSHLILNLNYTIRKH